MPITTAEEFLSVLERSNLLPPAELAKARDLSADFDATQFAKTLARNQIITPWQAAHLLQGRTSFLLGKYRLIQLLGRGGMGSVFLASHVVMHRKVALKSIPARIAQNPDALERFLAEARTIAALDHPNIVRAYSVDNEGKRYYLVMEYVDGMDLQRAVEAYGPLDVEACVDYIRQAADGLAHAHKRNMIHCDIKPSNLIVTELDGTVKILDMGLARLVHDKPGGTESGSAENPVLGSVDYLAPEQALASPDFNHRADIYSLGCTLYFLLTGHPPFPTGTLAQKIVKHQTQEPADVTRERPDVSANLAVICRKMMAKNPADRYQTAAEVRDVLAAWQPEVPQPVKKTIAIKKIERIEDLRPTSPWEQDFGEELKSAAGTSGANEFGPPPGTSGKMPVLKNGSSSVKLKKLLAGTRERLIITSCTVAALLVLVIGGSILAYVYGGGASRTNEKASDAGDRPTNDQPPPVPVAPNVPVTPQRNPPTDTATPEPPATAKTDHKDGAPSEPAAPAPPAIVEQTPSQAPPMQSPQQTPQQTPQEPPPPAISAEQPPSSQLPPAPDPLRDLRFSLELPDYDAKSGDISLGKLHLEGQAKLQIELVGGDRVGKGIGKYSIQEDPNAVGGQAWNIGRNESHNKTAPVARLRIKDQDLRFDWAQTTPAWSAPLRNCGVNITVGEAKRFVQFRLPKNADPLVLELDKVPPTVHVRVDNPPDADRIKLRIPELKSPFPANDVKLEVAVSQTKRKIEIVFTDPANSAFSIHLFYDAAKGNTVDLEAWGVLAANSKKPFKLSAADGRLAEVTAEVGRLERRLEGFGSAKANAAAKNAAQQQIAAKKTEQQQCADIVALAKKLNGAAIPYRIVADYDKYEVELANSSNAAPDETADTLKNHQVAGASGGQQGK